MKQKDIAVIVVSVFIGGIFALLLSSLVISSDQNSRQKAEVVEPISNRFPEVDDDYFNDQSIDPTQLIRIGESTNPTPFNGE